MGRLFQGAATVDSILRGDLIERAADAGLAQPVRRLRDADAGQPARAATSARIWGATTRRSPTASHDLGIMINGSFVFGMDDDDEDVFRRTVDWAIEQRHHDRDVPHPDAVSGDAAASRECAAQGASSRATGICYDTRHVVYRPARLTPEALKDGYDWAYREFYRWSSIARASLSHGSVEASGEAFLLCGRLEEVRAALEPGDSRAAAAADDAAARSGAVEGNARRE